MTSASTWRVAAAVTATAGRPGHAARTARAWLDTLAARAEIRSERHIRNSASRRWVTSQARQTRVCRGWI